MRKKVIVLFFGFMCFMARAETAATLFICQGINVSDERVEHPAGGLSPQETVSGKMFQGAPFTWNSNETMASAVRKSLAHATGKKLEEACVMVTNGMLVAVSCQIASRLLSQDDVPLIPTGPAPPFAFADAALKILSFLAPDEIALVRMDNLYILTPSFFYEKKTPLIISGRFTNYTDKKTSDIEAVSDTTEIVGGQAVVDLSGKFIYAAHIWVSTRVIVIGKEKYVLRESAGRSHDLDIRVGGVVAKRLTIDLTKEQVYHVDIDLGALGADPDGEKEEKRVPQGQP